MDGRTPGPGVGARLRARRLALGRSLQELSDATRIPVAHLEALEDDREEDLPAGPYAAAYLRTLSAELELEEGSDEPELTVSASGGPPLWVVRAIAVTSMFVLVVVLASFLWDRLAPSLAGTGGPAADDADQLLVLVPLRSTRLVVQVDGEEAFSGEVAGGDRKEFAARTRFAVEVGAISDVRIEWNGEEVVPQGRQDAPRRLVFVDDADQSPLGEIRGFGDP